MQGGRGIGLVVARHGNIGRGHFLRRTLCSGALDQGMSTINLPSSSTSLRRTNRTSVQLSKLGSTLPTAPILRPELRRTMVASCGPVSGQLLKLPTFALTTWPFVCPTCMAMYSARAVPLPVYMTFEILDVNKHGAGLNLFWP